MLESPSNYDQDLLDLRWFPSVKLVGLEKVIFNIIVVMVMSSQDHQQPFDNRCVSLCAC